MWSGAMGPYGGGYVRMERCDGTTKRGLGKCGAV